MKVLIKGLGMVGIMEVIEKSLEISIPITPRPTLASEALGVESPSYMLAHFVLTGGEEEHFQYGMLPVYELGGVY